VRRALKLGKRDKEELDWRPTIDLENGIARIADWLKSHANRPK